MFEKIRTRVSERFADVWVLLSNTDRFVSRAGIMSRFESQLREWRSRLQLARGDQITMTDIRNEIVAWRRARREEGWELRLGSLDIQVKGFRSDDALSRGFQRIVLMTGTKGQVYFVVGSANHIELYEDINRQLQQASVTAELMPHFLWYRRMDDVIELAGADSEDRESYERLKEYVEIHKSDLVKVLIKLR